MGGLCPERQHQICVVMTGVNNTGKTTILYQLKFKESIKTAPTNGFNMESIEVGGRSMTIWEVGGQVAVRRFWQYHYEDKDGIIYVVDASRRDNVRAAHDQFQKMLNSPQLDGLPVLVYANRFDDKETLPLVEIIEMLNLQNSRGRRWKIQYTNGITGEGIQKGIQWLKNVIQEDQENTLQMFKTWRRFKDILLNIRDGQRRCAHRLKRVFGKMRRSNVIQQDHIKSKVSKDTSDKYQLKHYLTMLKDRRTQLYEQFKAKRKEMQEASGELSKMDAEGYFRRIDGEMHELYQQMIDVQRRLDELGSD